MTFAKVLSILVFLIFIYPTGNSASADTLKTACIGNSITSVPGLDPEHNYPAQLEKMLSDSIETGNFGSPGATMLKNADQPYWERGVFSDVLYYNPDIAIIKLGTNDSKPYNWDPYGEEFIDDYKCMIDTLRSLNNPPLIWACFPAPAFSSAYNIDNDNILFEIIPAVRQAASFKCAGIIDLYSALEGKPELLPDGVHPDSAGAYEIADKIFQTISYDKPPITKQNNVLTAPQSRYYMWYLNFTPIAEENGGNGKVFSAEETGVYRAAIKPFEDSEDIIVLDPVEVDSADLETAVQERIHSTITELYSRRELVIYSLSGRKYTFPEKNISDRESLWRILNLPKGIYIVKSPKGMIKIPVVH